MAERAEALAQRFEQTNNDVIAAVEGCSDDQWKATTKEEGWPVGVTAHHVAGGHPAIIGFVQAIANVQPLPPITREMLNEMNAKHAREFANCTRQETLAMLRANGAAAAATVRALSDEQLDRTGVMATVGNAPVSAQQVIEMVLIGHPQGHLQSMKGATA